MRLGRAVSLLPSSFTGALHPPRMSPPCHDSLAHCTRLLCVSRLPLAHRASPAAGHGHGDCPGEEVGVGGRWDVWKLLAHFREFCVYRPDMSDVRSCRV